MKISSLIKHPILILIFSVKISSCCKEYANNNINKENLGYDQMSIKDKYFDYPKKIQQQIRELQNINIIYFDFDQYNVLPQFIQILQKHANFLYTHPDYKIIIEGHTDERGTPEYNIALGERRANSIKIYLQIQGVLENQISILSYGKEKPVLVGHSEKEHVKNRRAVLVY